MAKEIILILSIRKGQLKVVGYLFTKQGLDNITLQGYTEYKSDRRSHRDTYLTILCDHMLELGSEDSGTLEKRYVDYTKRIPGNGVYLLLFQSAYGVRCHITVLYLISY